MSGKKVSAIPAAGGAGQQERQQQQMMMMDPEEMMRRRQFEEEMMMMENMAPMDMMSNPWEDGFGSPFGPRGRGGMRGGMRGMGRRSFPDMGDMMGMLGMYVWNCTRSKG